MRKLLIIIGYSLYLFILLGLILHTSANPQHFGKYTTKYLIGLFILVLGFVPFILFLIFLTKKTVLRIAKRTYKISPFVKFLICLCLLVLFMIPAESYLRLKYKNYESTAYLYTIENFHPFLQFQLTQQTSLPVNSYNFRGSQIRLKKPPNTYRIFVLGGSTVLNSSIPFDKTLTTLLEKKLRSQYPDRQIEVINAGNDGYTTEHSLIQYLFKIKDFQPDLIIMWHGINDWYYNCSPQDKAYGSFKTDYSHFFGADAQMVYSHFSTDPVFSFKLITFDKIVKFISDNLYSDITNLTKYKDPNFYTQRIKNNEYEMDATASLYSYSRNIQSLINQLKADNVSLLLGDQPVLYSESLSKETLAKLYFPVLHCSKDGKYPSLESTTQGMDKFNQAAFQIAENNDTPFVSLNKALPKTLEYYIDDVHYSVKGNSVIAKTLFESIIHYKFIED